MEARAKGGRVGQRGRPGGSPAPGWDGGLEGAAEAALDRRAFGEHPLCAGGRGAAPPDSAVSLTVLVHKIN